jgi:hypothetical protein
MKPENQFNLVWVHDKYGSISCEGLQANFVFTIIPVTVIIKKTIWPWKFMCKGFTGMQKNRLDFLGFDKINSNSLVLDI